MKSGRVQWQKADETRKDFNIVVIHQDKKFFISDDSFEYIYHMVCAINLHSITNSGSIPGGQILSKRQTVFFTAVNPINKDHKDPDTIDLEAPRLDWYKQKVENTSRHGVLGRYQSCSKEGLKFYQTRSNAIILYNTLPAYCIPKAIKMVRFAGSFHHVQQLLNPIPSSNCL